MDIKEYPHPPNQRRRLSSPGNVLPTTTDRTSLSAMQRKADKRTRLAKNISEKLLEQRWLLIALLCAVGIVFETIDNLVDSEQFDGAYIRETQ